MIEPVNIEDEARRLLNTGMSERKVAEAMGLSRRQVSKIKGNMPKDPDPNPVFPDLLPTMSRAEAITELVRLSTRSEGVRRSEMWPVMRAHYGLQLNEKTGLLELNMTEHQFRYLKEKTTEAARNQGKTALFIPEWLPRQTPVAANDALLEMAGWLHDRAQEYASEFTHAFPDASRKQVFSELICLAFQQASPEPTPTRCQRNAKTSRQLQRRLGAIAGKPAANEPFPFVPDAELDKLCI